MKVKNLDEAGPEVEVDDQDCRRTAGFEHHHSLPAAKREKPLAYSMVSSVAFSPLERLVVGQEKTCDNCTRVYTIELERKASQSSVGECFS